MFGFCIFALFFIALVRSIYLIGKNESGLHSGRRRLKLKNKKNKKRASKATLTSSSASAELWESTDLTLEEQAMLTKPTFMRRSQVLLPAPKEKVAENAKEDEFIAEAVVISSENDTSEYREDPEGEALEPEVYVF